MVVLADFALPPLQFPPNFAALHPRDVPLPLGPVYYSACIPVDISAPGHPHSALDHWLPPPFVIPPNPWHFHLPMIGGHGTFPRVLTKGELYDAFFHHL